MSRRDWLRAGSLLAGTALCQSPSLAANLWAKPTINIGACDWSLGKAADVGAFDIARQIGLAGIQVSYNSEADETYLARADTIKAVAEAAKRTGVAVASLGMARLNEVPYKSEPRTEAWVSHAIDAAKALNAPNILLAFFNKNDLRNDPVGQKAVISRLRAVAPKAEKAGVTLSIESYLTAAEHLDIIQAVGSKAVRVYYDFRNATDAGNDTYKEIPMLGKQSISEVHMKENGHRLGEGTLDWPRISKALAAIGYEGWMQIEWAMAKDDSLIDAYQHNLAFLRRLFPA